ncbi:uncharacterized protein [Coffea arabica]|uniref:Uncharacterized protein n=1 Tax=Coffea arabica TaxID=13443 RepID=A0A6P6U2S2_COFAR|nr:uncharacterized protein LOC113706922 isoform X2 [Coffea arabica]XP_027084796.1 uncharacterized protein LOC113706922 isoform X2 [Coffea arabica]
MAVSSSCSLDCPVYWLVDMTKIIAGHDCPPLQPEAGKAALVAALLLIILLSWVLISMDNFRDAIFMCQHGICRPMRKVMGLLTWMGALGVIIKLLPSLVANGYGVCELYRYVVAFGFVFYIGIVFRACLSLFQTWPTVSLSTSYKPRSMEENNFETYGCFTSYSDIDNIRRDMNYLTSHARHMIDIGSLSVRLVPVVLMLVLIAIRWNPLHILIMFFYWICLTIVVMQWSLPHFAYSQIEVVPLHDKKVESVIRHLGLSPLQIFLLKTGNAVFNMAKLILYFASSRLRCFVRMIHR